MASAAAPELPSKCDGSDTTSSRANSDPVSLKPRDQSDASQTTRVATSAATSPANVVRKKLPWLEKQPPRAKTATTQQFLVNGGANPHSPISQQSNTGGKAAIHPMGGDLSLRAIASTPSLRQKNTITNSLAYSEKSQLPPGSRISPMFGRRPEPGKPPKAAYASSEYSAPTSDDGRRALGTSPAISPELPEGLGHDKPALASDTAGLRATKNSKPRPSPLRKRAPDVSTAGRKDRCRSCDDHDVPRRFRNIPDPPQQQHRSIASHESSIYKAPASRPLPTKPSTLYSLPVHLMPSSESSSPKETYEATRVVPSTYEKPKIRSSFHFKGPILSTAGRSQPNESLGSLNRAVTGLENLVGEALTVARDAAKSGRPDEVASLLNEATLALRQATSVQSNLRQPLDPSSADSMRSSDADQEDNSDASSCPSREASAETMPTMLTKSSMQPLRVGHTSKPILAPQARSAGAADRLHRDSFMSSPPDSISHTPPRLYPAASAESVVRDFAYGKAPRKYSARSNIRALYGAAASFYGDHGESVATQPGIRKSIALDNKQLPKTPRAA